MFLIPIFENAHKLITREDAKNYHVHKILGVLTLAHFAYRGALFYRYGSMFFEQTHPMLLWLFWAIHVATSTSSLLFHIPTNRAQKLPMIWPEFRMHSIVFGLRSLVAMALIMLGHGYNFHLRFATIMITLMCADAVTAYYKKKAANEKEFGTTMRSMPFPIGTPDIIRNGVNTFYSVSQVLATMNILYSTNMISMERTFMVLFPIQLAPFLMTLVRKSIIRNVDWHLYYGGSLLLNYVHGNYMPLSESFPNIYWLSTATFCIFRFYGGINKYILWLLIGIANY